MGSRTTLETQKVLVVDDDRDLSDLLREVLLDAGYRVDQAHDGAAALDRARKFPPDLVVLDFNLPDMTGVDVCRALRAHDRTRKVPILMLTVRGNEKDKVSAFEVGADDYVTKPFSPREVELRIRAILRRLEPEMEDQVLQADALTVDIPGHRVTIGKRELELTATEFRLLAYLLANRGEVQGRDALLERVWGLNAAVYTRTVDTHVNRLRDKLGVYGARIETLRGVGYRFTA